MSRKGKRQRALLSKHAKHLSLIDRRAEKAIVIDKLKPLFRLSDSNYDSRSDVDVSTDEYISQESGGHLLAVPSVSCEPPMIHDRWLRRFSACLLSWATNFRARPQRNVLLDQSNDT